jgi:hypothetical protein
MAARIVALDPKDGWAREYHRALLLFVGDVEGFRRAHREAEAAGLDFDHTLSQPTPFLGESPVAHQRKPDGALPAGVNLLADWKSLDLGVRAYRDGRFADALRHLEEVPKLTDHQFALTLNGFFLAMAHQKLGQVAEARRDLGAARKRLDGLGRAYGWRDSSWIAERELMDYGWTEWLKATIVSREAEALILYDPIFPADPFAP